MSKYISQGEQKQSLPSRPRGKLPLVRGMSEQEVILADGNTRQLLVLDKSQERYTDFSTVFKVREVEVQMDTCALGIFHHLATAIADHRNVCEITIEQCARLVHKSKTVVIRCFNELIEAQYIRRIKEGTYMLSPYRTVQISKQYFPILEHAWKIGNIDNIKTDIEKYRDKAKERTARNRQLVQDTNLSSVPEAVTLPEIESLPVEERVPYIKRVKRSQKLLKALEKSTRAG